MSVLRIQPSASGCVRESGPPAATVALLPDPRPASPAATIAAAQTIKQNHGATLDLHRIFTELNH